MLSISHHKPWNVKTVQIPPANGSGSFTGLLSQQRWGFSQWPHRVQPLELEILPRNMDWDDDSQIATRLAVAHQNILVMVGVMPWQRPATRVCFITIIVIMLLFFLIFLFFFPHLRVQMIFFVALMWISVGGTWNIKKGIYSIDFTDQRIKKQQKRDSWGLYPPTWEGGDLNIERHWVNTEGQSQ